MKMKKEHLIIFFWDNDCKYWYMYDETYYKIIQLIYRLIIELEQEKEKNKELEKENWIMRTVDKQYISKDKIRAKIEELENKSIDDLYKRIGDLEELLEE